MICAQWRNQPNYEVPLHAKFLCSLTGKQSTSKEIICNNTLKFTLRDEIFQARYTAVCEYITFTA